MPLGSPAAVLHHPFLGILELYASAQGITRLVIQPGTGSAAAVFQGRDIPAPVQEAVAQLTEYFLGHEVQFSAAVDWTAMPPFQRLVLLETRRIPYGQVTTYAHLAQRVGKPGAARAVGHALATNPIPVLIPCHRIVGSDRRLRGYSAPGGIRAKAWLLALEGAILPEAKSSRKDQTP